jgi:hypothetical protein
MEGSMGEAKRRAKHRREHGVGVLAGKYIPADPVFTVMESRDLFAGKTKLRNDLVSYLAKFTNDPDEITAFAVAVTTYSTMVDGGDTDVTVDMLHKLARETEEMRVPYLDVEGGAL